MVRHVPKLLGLAALVFAPAAHASQLIARNATGVRLQVNQSQASVTFRSGGATKHVLAWGAVNALSPNPRRNVDWSSGGIAITMATLIRSPRNWKACVPSSITTCPKG